MIILCASPWIPPEWIAAHGFAPRGAWLAGSGPAAALPEGACPFARSMVELARGQGECALVWTTACDQMRRAFDLLADRRAKPSFLFNLPATWQSPAARRLYEAEISRLGGFLESLGGSAPPEARLAEVMRQFEEGRQHLRTWISKHPGLPGARALANFFGHGALPPSAESSPADPPRGVPLAIIGGPLPSSQWPVLEVIELAGGSIVLNATEPGERCLLPPLPHPAPREAPLTTLTRHYFDNAIDVFHRPNSRLYAWLAPRLEARQVRGLILWTQVGCDLWRAEAESLRETCQRPVLLLDSPSLSSGHLRDKNRLAAFIESLA